MRIFETISFIFIFLIIVISFYFIIKQTVEHPCLKYEYKERCFMQKQCVIPAPFMIPGFCITEEYETCVQDSYCIDKK